MIAIRETAKGYKVTQLFIQKDFYGIEHKYSKDTNLVYKRKEYAEKQCKSFYAALPWTKDLPYIGVIKENEYRGEVK